MQEWRVNKVAAYYVEPNSSRCQRTSQAVRVVRVLPPCKQRYS